MEHSVSYSTSEHDTITEQQEIVDDHVRATHWWHRFRRVHSYGLILRMARQYYAIRVRKKAVVGVPAAKHSISVTGVSTCTVGNGDVLRGSLLLPNDVSGPFPCILIRTPYGRRSDFGQVIFAEQGYAVLVQDTRGRFSSDGQFVPVQNEREDGPTTVNWIRRQPWCNGKVGVMGISYLGFTAWASVDDADVDAIVPVITQSSVKSAVFQPGGGISFELIVLWFYLVVHLMSEMEHDPLSFLRKLWQGGRQRIVRRALSHVPLREVDSILLGYRHDFLQDGLAALGDPDNPFWEDKDRLCHFRKLPPCHILTGWYDFFLAGALEDYAQAKKKQQRVSLTIGPFSHWGLMGSLHRYYATALNCFDVHLKGKIPAEDEEEFPVRLYILGCGWRRYADYPPPAKSESWWLQPNFALLAERVADRQLQHRYFYDPARPTPALGGPSFNPLNTGACDQRRIEARHDVLVYSTMPFEVTSTFVGTVSLRLDAAWESPGIDFVGRLCHVDRDGASTNLCEGLTSRCHPAGRRGLDFGPTSLEVDLGAVAVKVRPGERLRLHVCSAAHPRWLRNLGSDEHVASATTFCPGHVEVHGGELLLPRELPSSNSAHQISKAENQLRPQARL